MKMNKEERNTYYLIYVPRGVKIPTNYIPDIWGSINGFTTNEPLLHAYINFFKPIFDLVEYKIKTFDDMTEAEFLEEANALDDLEHPINKDSKIYAYTLTLLDENIYMSINLAEMLIEMMYGYDIYDDEVEIPLFNGYILFITMYYYFKDTFKPVMKLLERIGNIYIPLIRCILDTGAASDAFHKLFRDYSEEEIGLPRELSYYDFYDFYDENYIIFLSLVNNSAILTEKWVE